MNTIDMYLALDDINKQYPELKHNESDQLILRTLIYTNYALDSVEYITGQDKQSILDVYQKIMTSPLPQLSQRQEPVERKKFIPTKPRRFKRIEMIEFLKEELKKANPSIEFVHLKYNILTCQLGERFFTIYVSTSRDYEFLKDEELIIKKRVAAWHKGDEQIFSDHDYYALMVKIDNESEYVTDNDQAIEYIILDQAEMQEWLSQKRKNQSGMINCYVHYIQEKNSTNIRKIEDSRETPKISLIQYHRRGYLISE
ncbi:hypothetical protein [Macrococcoides caseolyticum]|uniref:hypothetical protein n=1 Tax=Macrococcoides caseolyticum TaxID=69966 RepID=UPI001F472B6D|nr:hypothetical protein [Macrococcus caseolyticus]MCE4956065.1 hypothetical protein [Macrococcus caseolyticus]